MQIRKNDYDSIDWSEIFEYSESSPTGLIWKINKSRSKVKRGRIAGSKSGDGYWQVKYNYCTYKCHVIVWYLHNKTVSGDKCLDHKDRCKANNMISNLHEVTPTQNKNNRTISKKNSSGLAGVTVNTDEVRASWSVDGQAHYRSFSIKKFGLERALRLAELARLEGLKNAL